MTRAPAAAAAAALLCAACGSAPEVQPFRGPAPQTIAVLPIRGPDLPEPLRAILDDHAHEALSDRGYSVVPSRIVGPTLDPDHPLDLMVLGGLHRDFEADAALERTARLLPGVVAGRGKAVAVRWTFLATADGAVLWTREETIAPGQVTSRHVVGPQDRYEPDPFFTDEPLAGRGEQQWVTETRAREPVDLAAALQRALASRIPRAVFVRPQVGG